MMIRPLTLVYLCTSLVTIQDNNEQTVPDRVSVKWYVDVFEVQAAEANLTHAQA